MLSYLSLYHADMLQRRLTNNTVTSDLLWLKMIKAAITPPTSLSQYSDTAHADRQYQKTTSLPPQTKAYALYCSIWHVISNKILVVEGRSWVREFLFILDCTSQKWPIVLSGYKLHTIGNIRDACSYKVRTILVHCCKKSAKRCASIVCGPLQFYITRLWIRHRSDPMRCVFIAWYLPCVWMFRLA